MLRRLLRAAAQNIHLCNDQIKVDNYVTEAEVGLFWEEKISIAPRIARASKLKQILRNVRCKNVDHTLGLEHRHVAMGMAENAGDSHDAPYLLAEHPRFSCGVRYQL